MGIILVSQGLPFIHAGQEMCRTKKGEENSYNKPDDINGIDWERQSSFADMLQWTKSLIELRKKLGAFNFGDANLVRKNVSVQSEEQLIVYRSTTKTKKYVVIINGSADSKTSNLLNDMSLTTVLSNKFFDNKVKNIPPRFFGIFELSKN
jgi:pullulanase